MSDKLHRIGDVSIAEAVDRCIKIYGIEGTEQMVTNIYTHLNLKELRKQFLAELYSRYK